MKANAPSPSEPLPTQQTAPCVLIVSLYPTHPTKGGRMIRLLQLAVAIRQIGYRPILLYQDFTSGDMAAMRAFWGSDIHFVRYRANNLKWWMRRAFRFFFSPSSSAYRALLRLQSWVRNSQDSKHQEFHIQLDDLYDDFLSPHIKAICRREQPCALVCLEVFMTKAFEASASSALRILDTNDVYAIGRTSEEKNETKLWVNLSLEDELRGYRRADLVWAIQEKDEENIRRSAPEINVSTVGHLIDLASLDVPTSLRSGKVLFVASKHKWNVQGLRWFANEVFPFLKDRLPERNVVIAGDISDVLGSEMGFTFLGRVTDLASVYKDCRVVISPILGGAGLKIKNIEAMGHAKAVVSTRAAARGLEFAENQAFLVGNDPASFAQAVRRVLEDDGLCQQLMEGSVAFAREWNKSVLAALRRSFETSRNSDGPLPPARISTHEQNV